MRVAVDATPLLGRRTGIGRYVEQLVAELAGAELAGAELAGAELGPGRRLHDLLLVPVSVRGRGGLHPPPGVRVSRLPLPARALQAAWARGGHPALESLVGRVDVVHGTNFVLPPRRRAAGVVTVHDLTFLRHPEAVTPQVLRYRELVPRSAREADVVLCPASATADDVAAELGVPREKVRATPLGVDPAWAAASPLAPEALAGLGLPRRYVLFVGTREPRKDLATLVRAHDLLVARDPSAPDLVLVGPAGWGEQPAASARRHLLDYAPVDVLRGLVAGAAAVAMPSRYEGFGLPVLEGLACGRPVVASDIPVHREVAGGCARYSPVGDVEALADALARAVADDEEAGAVARQQERRRRASAFTWRACAAATADAYVDAHRSRAGAVGSR